MPSPVDKYFKEVKDGNPSYSDEQAWATAWSIYCKHKNPGSEHCHMPTSEYLKGKSAAAEADKDLKKALVRLSVAKKAMAAMSEAEAAQLADDARKLHREASGLFDAQHRSKGNYYDPVDPSLVERLRNLHAKVLKGLGAVARIDAKDADPLLTKNVSDFGRMDLRLDTLSEAAGLAYTIENKALLVLYKAKRAAKMVSFYTNWIDSYKATGLSPSFDDQWKWMRNASDPAREFQDAIIVRNVVARVMQEYTAKAEAKKAEKRYAENKKLLGEMETLRRKVENADESAAKKFDRAYTKLFENGEAAAKAGQKLLNEYGGEDVAEWVSTCVRQWNGNAMSHRETDGPNVPVHLKMKQLPNTYAYAQQLDAAIKDFDKLLKDPDLKLDESWRH